MFACGLFLIDDSKHADTLQTQPGIVRRQDHNALLSLSVWKGNLYHLIVIESSFQHSVLHFLYCSRWCPCKVCLFSESWTERERGSLGWTSPGLIQIEWEGFPLYWLGGLWWQSNSVFFGSSGSLPVISAEGQRVCWRLPSPSFTQPRCGRWQDLSSLK